MKKRKKNIEAQPVYDPIVIPGQPHQNKLNITMKLNYQTI
jgi:hypothetical protein